MAAVDPVVKAPESFSALLVRLERVAPAGDSKLTLGKGAMHMDHGAMH